MSLIPPDKATAPLKLYWNSETNDACLVQKQKKKLFVLAETKNKNLFVLAETKTSFWDKRTVKPGSFIREKVNRPVGALWHAEGVRNSALTASEAAPAGGSARPGCP